MSTDLNSHELAETRVQRGFWIHLGVYVVVNSGLAALNLTRNPDHKWVLWVIGGWGLGLLLHAAAVYLLPGAHDRIVSRVESRIDRRQQRRM